MLARTAASARSIVLSTVCQSAAVRGTMDTAADYLAQALECEAMAERTPVGHARTLFLAIAAQWREMALAAAEKDANRQPSSPTSVSA